MGGDQDGVGAVGPAVQTLGGILRATDKETYSRAELIAGNARVPLATARKHLKALESSGWILNKGRESTRSGRPRRTCTIILPKRTLDAARESYGVLPWWACCEGDGEFPWCAKAVLSVVMAQLMAMKKVVEEQQSDLCSEDYWAGIEELGDYRFRFAVSQIRKKTGLSRESVVRAKTELASRGIICWTKSKRDDRGDDGDILMPRQDFRILITPSGEPGRCFVDFENSKAARTGGPKSG